MSTPLIENPKAFSLILIHGHGTKPPAPDLLQLWQSAMEAGLARDFPGQPGLASVDIQLVYYADLSSRHRPETSDKSAMDRADRQNALAGLVARKTPKQFRRVHYEALPGKTSIKEFLADVGTPISNVLGLGEKRIAHVIPELIEYWNDTEGFAKQLHQRLADVLVPALVNGNHIMVISHCLGSIAAYDAFWRLTHADQSGGTGARINTWVTIGSPLADNYVRNRLLGGRSHPDTTGAVTYPEAVINWLNVAAEDDYYCHDETMANDFSAMLRHKFVSRIVDYQIYNLTERFGRSDPHNALGYLIHPRVSRIINNWLTKDAGT